MCTLLFSYKQHPKYDFIFLGNRDEFKNRPTEKAQFWKSHTHVLAGVDLLKGGTWTGITKNGSMAFITNYRNFNLKKPPSNLSRGYLTKDYLITGGDPKDYMEKVKTSASDYDPFNLIVGNLQELYYFSNVENQVRKLGPGLYGLSNALLDTPWHKVEKSKEQLQGLLKYDFSIDSLFRILDDTEIVPDDLLPSTGLPIEKERMLSSIHIDTPEYGTMAKTVILIDKNKEVTFCEKTLNHRGYWESSCYNFSLD